jgi:methyl-accepting chemotaxis protein
VRALIHAGKKMADEQEMSSSMKNWSISRRVAMCFVLLLGCMVVLAGVSLYDMQGVVSTGNTRSYILVFAGGVLLSIFAVWRTVRKIDEVLQGSVTELSDATVQIASAASQVSASSQLLANGASEHAAMFQQTSNASTEISSISSQTTENSRLTADKMASSEATLQATNQSLTQMVDAMERINGSSQKISKIIKVIDEIAFQTNILALNAAVEAARAGEAGLGFAVVADEVRNLAMRCAQAARDTTGLIEESIANTKEGKARVDQVAVAIRTITKESSTIKELIDEINVGSVEQSRGIDQISNSILQMEQVTQSSASSAEESSAAAEELNAQAKAMKEIVERLRAMVDGGNGSSGGREVAEPLLRLSGAERLAES